MKQLLFAIGRKYNRESDGKDPKYAAATTGAGVYRKFKIDLYVEAPDVVSTTDGTYPIRPAAVAAGTQSDMHCSSKVQVRA